MVVSMSTREADMAVLTTLCETLDERIDRLLGSHGEAWPPLNSTTTHAVIEELIARVNGLEEALHAVALELESVAPEGARGGAPTADE
jgi:hypothetical protein